jgi:hypothetical protein
MYLCVRGKYFASFYNFGPGFRFRSGSAVLFAFDFFFFVILNMFEYTKGCRTLM